MKNISGFLTSVVLLVLLMILVIVGLAGIGLLDIRMPWDNIDLATEDTTITYDEAEPEPQIIRIDPLDLACHSRIFAQVPVRATREHELIGQTYRTDTVEMVAQGDVDTCVDAGEVRVEERSNGSFDVIIPAESIEFSRPRVDAVATMDSVEYDKGLIGKITDVFPWVSDNNSLTPAAYAFAQTVIGGSDCMQEAYAVTEQALKQAYENQMIEQGGEAGQIDVIIDGVPDFEQNELADDPAFADFLFDVDNTASLCSMTAGAVPIPVENPGDL